MKIYGNCGSLGHTTFRPTPATTSTKHPPKATALGADLMKPPGHIAHLNKQARKRRGRPKTEAAPKTCEQCGNEFTKPPTLSNFNWGKRRFCGRACSNTADAAAKKAPA